ncbi:hypothetical protein CK203_013003 [Vitis vinifera]|uniref:Core Histone H2A/H2B/H3 domain-containing protein n=1 Tax=Vitis vinifera TaxID=29760 RepID=A0A438JMG3_VITVI|nr:hypothetical protein CK203_013003 [Vitis vinifera]
MKRRPTAKLRNPFVVDANMVHIPKVFHANAATIDQTLVSPHKLFKTPDFLPCCFPHNRTGLAAEDYLVHLFEDAMLCAIHAKRVTLSKLMELACFHFA